MPDVWSFKDGPHRAARSGDRFFVVRVSLSRELDGKAPLERYVAASATVNREQPDPAGWPAPRQRVLTPEPASVQTRELRSRAIRSIR
jgi:hypothetical protein